MALSATRRPKVSVGLTVYNGERFLAETLDSLVAQTFEDFELLVCDNASTDRTAEIVGDYAAKDPRIRYVRHQRNVGASGNERRAFALASAPYFRWSAADDLYAPESIARCVEVLDREPRVVLTYPRTKLIDDRGQIIGDCDDRLHLPDPRPAERFRQLFERITFCNAQYGLMRADAIRRTRLVGDFPSSDSFFLAELVLYGTFHEIPEVLFFRRIHEHALKSQVGEEKQAHYRPDRPQALQLPGWRRVWEHLRSVTRAPLPVSDRVRLAGYLLRRAVWDRDRLAREVVDAAYQLLGGHRAPATRG